MYLESLTITNFRRLEEATVSFRPGLNVIVGENNSGKTAIIDGIRALLNDYSVEPDDIRIINGARAIGASIVGTFDGLSSVDDEAAFLEALIASGKAGAYKARIALTATLNGDHIDRSIALGAGQRGTAYYDILTRLRLDYLPPLRDPNSSTRGLRAGRNSRVAELIKKTTTDEEKDALLLIATRANRRLKSSKPLGRATGYVRDNLELMSGGAAFQDDAELNFLNPEFPRLAAQLEAYSDGRSIGMSGLGSGNLIYIAAVLGELEKANDSERRYRVLIIEEPEAHLHPHRQVLLLRFLRDQVERATRPLQVFVTTHSPIFASEAALESLLPISHVVVAPKTPHDAPKVLTTIKPVIIDPDKKEVVKIRQYLDATRSELFFARKILLVEGDSERFALPSLARAHNNEYDFERAGISLLSAAGLNFAVFLPFVGADGMNVRAAIVTDGDPPVQAIEGEEYEPSDYVKKLQTLVDEHANVKLFPSEKTFEFDIALPVANRSIVLQAISKVRPRKGPSFKIQHDALSGPQFAEKFHAEFFKNDKTSKAQFASELALLIDSGEKVVVPPYLTRAFDFIFGES